MIESLVFVLIAVAVVGLSLLALFWQSFVLIKLWSWFMVPLFNAPDLSLAQGVAILLVVSFLMSRYTKRSKQETIEAFFFEFIGPFIVLAFGFIVKLILM